MKKIIPVILALSLISAILAGCGSSVKLAEGFDDAEVKLAAENSITTLNSGDYEAFCALADDSLQETFTPEVIENAVNQVMPEAGEFVELTSETVAGQKDSSGNDYAVAVIVAKYENQSVTYTVSLNKDLMLIGFYLK